MKLLNPTKPTTDGNRLSGKTDDTVWILDTSTTHHMTGRIDLLEDINLVSLVSVKFPAGANILTTQRGTIRLTSHIYFQNVYYVDDFHTNLISFCQYLTDNSLVGQVTDRLVILQDRTTKILIGAGEQEEDGLYLFISWFTGYSINPKSFINLCKSLLL